MLKEAFKRDKYYWLAISITIALAYGFTLTHFSMGVDDESFDIYFRDGGLLAQGRWGGQITRYIFNTYDFLPFWRDFIGILLITAGVTIWGYVIQKYSDYYFNNASITVFSCVAICCPFIVDNFIFMSTTIEMGTVLCLIPLTLNFFFEYAVNKKSFKYIIISVVFFTYSLAFSELAVVYFLMGIFIVCLVKVSFSETKNNFTIPKIFIVLLKGVSLIVVVLLLNSIITFILQKALSVSPSGYTSNYIQYDFSSLGNFIDSLFKFLKSFFGVDYISQNNIGAYIASSAGVLLLLYSAVVSFEKRKTIYLLLGLGCVIAAFSMYFITGNIHLAKRILITNSVFTGFVSALFFMYFQNKIFFKIKLRNVMTLLVVLIILYSTKHMNQVFYTDYQRYQLDIAKMNSIVEEIQMNNDDDFQKEIVFIGIPENYNLKIGDTEGYSIFQFGRFYGLENELRNSRRIFSFINLHGYNIKQLKNMDEQEIITNASGMQHYPNKGYVKDFDDYLIVKLGPSPYATSELTLNEFNKNYSNDVKDVEYSKDWFSYEANVLSIGGWGHINGVNSSDTTIQVALINDQRQYILRTDTEIIDEGTGNFNNGLNIAYRIYSLSTTTLVNGTYHVVLIFSDNENKRVVPIGETLQIP